MSNAEHTAEGTLTADARRETFAEPHDELWQKWAETRSATVRDTIVRHYLPLARMVAGKVFRDRTDLSVPFDDYLQYARVGLLESIERFDHTRGTPFQAFAFHRIRGAILNGLARESEVAAQREAARRIACERRESLLAHGGVGIEAAGLEELIELTVGLALGALLDDPAELADDSLHANPYAATEVMHLRRLAWSAVERLPPREQELIRAHYYEQREFRELAVQWAISTGRVSQLHARALVELRRLLAAEPTLNRRV